MGLRRRYLTSWPVVIGLYACSGVIAGLVLRTLLSGAWPVGQLPSAVLWAAAGCAVPACACWGVWLRPRGLGNCAGVAAAVVAAAAVIRAGLRTTGEVIYAVSMVQYVMMSGVCAAILLLAIAGPVRKGRERRAIGRCRVCGYMLRGLPSDACPECGVNFDSEQRAQAGPVDEYRSRRLFDSSSTPNVIAQRLPQHDHDADARD